MISPRFKLGTEEAANLLDGLVSVGISQIHKAKIPKGVYPILSGVQSGRVRYERYDPDEHWQSWRELRQQLERSGRARGDCEDLSAAIVAELTVNGIEARTYTYNSAPGLYHVVVWTRRWGLLDPSRAAGMEG
jgi:hypothetical protein